MGGVIDGMPAGIEIDLNRVQHELNRRRPGQSSIVTARDEKDQVKILSGMFEGANVLCGRALENGNGERCGYVFSCSDSRIMAELWELMFKIIMGAI